MKIPEKRFEKKYYFYRERVLDRKEGPLRKLFFISLLLFVLLPLHAQKKKVKYYQKVDSKLIHFGFTLGLNTMDFYVTNQSTPQNTDTLFANVNNLLPGFNVSVVTDLRLMKYLDLRFLPGLAFGQRDLYFYRPGGVYYSKQKIESSFLEFPLVLKYKAKRLNNVRPYLVAGFNYRMDMSARRKYNDDKAIYVRLQQSDLYHEEGFGIDFYLPYFKLSTELKVSTGFRNILVTEPPAEHPEYVHALQRLRSQIWVLSFHFE